ncbi:MAG: hypothetical protein R3A47_05830 [Polyangiales bacterium]
MVYGKSLQLFYRFLFLIFLAVSIGYFLFSFAKPLFAEITFGEMIERCLIPFLTLIVFNLLVWAIQRDARVFVVFDEGLAFDESATEPTVSWNDVTEIRHHLTIPSYPSLIRVETRDGQRHVAMVSWPRELADMEDRWEAAKKAG